ncbi:hypothetical protein PROFUN_06224 [Planoprotostelium fungivorum]|uniref:Vacuolar protein sorting-associated protein 11 homolog n=1 Tax=Planoprotostelium fungivorum TaxID=1890364 RepID=A0A2P6MZ35_9EUKA|nr:hypothetical protein PROFUN_06224 [Planoprotostelium fungivorum]
MFQWKTFQFFEKELVQVEGLSILEKSLITCSTSGRGKITFGDENGFINMFDRDFNTSISFQGYERMATHCQQLKSSNLLITIGDDEEAIAPTIKVWNLDKMVDHRPQLMKVVKIESPQPIPITALNVIESGEHTEIAVGTADGDVIIVKGIIQRDRAPQQVRYSTEKHNPITGIAFKEQNGRFVLFASTNDKVFAFFDVLGKARKEILDDVGCKMGCSVMSDAQEFILGKKEAVYFYGTEGRGACLAFEGDKKFLAWFRSYLIVIGQETNNSKFNTVKVYDLKNRFIAGSFEHKFQNITHVVSEWGSIFILTNENKLFQLDEKDTQTKLETLFKKNLYSVAINLARSQGYDMASIVDIYRRYGDYLYSKGDYDGAIGQYILTIGNLEPSYVIRKFLDAQRIHNLTSYLQSLHEKGLANADHTTLLFNCYTKLKDEKKLDEFIKNDSDAELNFEIETAIKACRQAGYYKHAIYLAKRHEQHEWYLKILLEDGKGYDEALSYISTLDFYEAENNMKKYGKTLIHARPEQTTQFLVSLCTNWVPRNEKGGEDHTKSSAKNQGNPEEYIYIYIGMTKWAIVFLENIIAKGIAANGVYTSLLDMYLSEDNEKNGRQEEKGKPMSELKKKALDLITSPQSKLDKEEALIICKSHNFGQGLLDLYKKLDLSHEVVQYYMDHDEYKPIIDYCISDESKVRGQNNPNLWIQVLSYFAGKETDCKKEIGQCLQYIERHNLLPPLLVVEILSKKSAATLDMVRDYIVRKLLQENKAITEDERNIREFQEETKKMRAEIEEIKTSAKIFQSNKCTYCTSILDLPAVHFLCMHSYHLRCLGDNESECPVCAPDNRKILEMKKSLEANAVQHDQFFKQLEGSTDGFTTVAEFFGRSIFAKPNPGLNLFTSVDRPPANRY